MNAKKRSQLWELQPWRNAALSSNAIPDSPLRHVLNDHQRGRLVRVVVPQFHDLQRTTAQRDHIACAPIRNGGAKRGRVGWCAVLVLEPVGEGHSVLASVSGWDRTAAESIVRSGVA